MGNSRVNLSLLRAILVNAPSQVAEKETKMTGDRSESRELTWQEVEELRKEESKLEPPADGMLRALVKFADEHGLSFGITLSVGGLLVSGILISRQDFMKLYSERWVSTTDDPETQEAWREAFRPLWEDREEDDFPEPRFRQHSHVHLKDTYIFHPAGQPIPSNEPTEWRVRLAAVDGWTLGSLSAG